MEDIRGNSRRATAHLSAKRRVSERRKTFVPITGEPDSIRIRESAHDSIIAAASDRPQTDLEIPGN